MSPQRSVSTLISFIVFTAFLPITADAQRVHTEPFQNAVVVSADELASRAGVEILQQGGNAVDAAVAVQFALAVTLPRAGNIGGGGFMMIHLEDGSVHALDFRETAPAAAHRDLFLNADGEYVPEKSRIGALASGVPGTVDGMISALERHGILPLETVLQPAIRLADEGYRLSHSQASDLNRHRDDLAQFESSAALFIREDGRDWQRGDLFVQLELAETLERIARQGRDGFYSGVTARLLVQEIRRNGGMMTLRDLRDYRSRWRQPIHTRFFDHDFYMMPPPSSGGIVISQLLTVLEQHRADTLGHNSAAYIHLLSETMRRSFADRNYYLGDPDVVQIPQNGLLSGVYMQERMRSFSPSQATQSSEVSHGEPEPFLEQDETTHFSIIDENGMAVAVTTTLNGSFGSYLSVTGAGFLMNNEMDDFSAKPGEPNMFGLIGAEANAIEPGKRMLSSMSPTIVTKNGTVRMVNGGAGGPRIITATIQNLLNTLLFDMTAMHAVSAPRFHHQWLPDRLTLEHPGISDDTIQILESMGHVIHRTGSMARTHFILVDEEGLRFGAPDPRGDGHAAGY
ncbi:MAG: gamma-glutamyltransferase [Balneolaceae bacterium]